MSLPLFPDLPQECASKTAKADKSLVTVGIARMILQLPMGKQQIQFVENTEKRKFDLPQQFGDSAAGLSRTSVQHNIQHTKFHTLCTYYTNTNYSQHRGIIVTDDV